VYVFDYQPYKKQEQVNFGDHVEVAKMALHNKVDTCLHIHLLASFLSDWPFQVGYFSEECHYSLDY